MVTESLGKEKGQRLTRAWRGEVAGLPARGLVKRSACSMSKSGAKNRRKGKENSAKKRMQCIKGGSQGMLWVQCTSVQNIIGKSGLGDNES